MSDILVKDRHRRGTATNNNRHLIRRQRNNTCLPRDNIARPIFAGVVKRDVNGVRPVLFARSRLLLVENDGRYHLPVIIDEGPLQTRKRVLKRPNIRLNNRHPIRPVLIRRDKGHHRHPFFNHQKLNRQRRGRQRHRRNTRRRNMRSLPQFRDHSPSRGQGWVGKL